MSQALSVAKELVRLSFAGEEPGPLTGLRLQKLLYYAQAWSLIVREGELFSDVIEAWRCGPVVPAASRALAGGQAAPAGPEVFAMAPDLPEDDARFIRCVWEAYSQYSPSRLSQMTREEPPWLRAWGDRPTDGSGNDPISVDDLEDHFGKQTVPAPLAAYWHDRRKKEEEAERALADLALPDAARFAAAARSFTPSVKLPAGS